MLTNLIKIIGCAILLTACAANNIVTPDSAGTQVTTYPLKEYHIQTGDQLDIKFLDFRLSRSLKKSASAQKKCLT